MDDQSRAVVKEGGITPVAEPLCPPMYTFSSPYSAPHEVSAALYAAKAMVGVLAKFLLETLYVLVMCY